MTGLPERALTPNEQPSEDDGLLPPALASIDEGALDALTQLYRRHFPRGGAILDLMSGWMPHLPPDAEYSRVVGIGRNATELAENPFLDEWLEQDLNQDWRLPFAEGAFDGAALCVGIQYLTRPVELLCEVGRVLKPRAPLIVTFSDRCSDRKPIACWTLLDDEGHRQLVAHFLLTAGNWTGIKCSACRSSRDPLYAVIAYSKGPCGS